MIKYNYNLIKYRVDPSGTEEILPSNDNGIVTCAPSLTILYGNITLLDLEFLYRQTNGGIPVAAGLSKIEGIKGGTIVWNQRNSRSTNSIATNREGVFEKNHFRTWFTKGVTSRLVLSFTSVGTLNLIAGHSYYVCYDCKTNIRKGLSTSLISSSYSRYFNVRQRYSYVVTTEQFRDSNSLSSNNSTRFNKGDYIDGYELVIDLTQIYGAGNEPTTPEQFEADYFKWFGKPLGYEKDNAGVLLPTMIDGLKSTGFNQYNSERGLIKAMVGDQYQITGTYSKVWESEEESPVFTEYTYGSIVEGAKYYSVGGSHYEAKGAVFEYDNESIWEAGTYCFHENQVYKCNTAIDTAEEWDATKWDLIADVAAMVTEGIFVPMDLSPDSNGIFTPSKFYVHVEGGNATDTCVHLVGDGARNGEYEQYQENNVSIHVTTLTGKLNGQGESVVVFPYGMRKAENVYDEIYTDANGITKAIKRIGVANLGAYNWTIIDSEKNVFGMTNYISDGKGGYSNTYMKCARYLKGLYTSSDSVVRGNGYYWKRGNSTPANLRIFVRDSSYTDAATFKTSMNGVYLYYQLATPIEYILDNQVPLKKRYINNKQVERVLIGSNKVWETDDWYGIRWCEETNVVERIGNPELHRTLPLQSLMRRCVVADNGTVYKYISDNDPFKYEDATTANYDGTDGLVMVEIPAYYHESGHVTIDNKLWNYIKLFPNIKYGVTSRKCYIGAFELILDNATNSSAKGCSVSVLDLSAMNVTSSTSSYNASDILYLASASTYRNYNYANTDTTDVKCSYGRPTTNRSRATFRGICARRGTNWSQQTWDAYNSLLRLYFVEYANFNSQATFNSSLTADGYRQGGLGAGVTNTTSAKWNAFNGYNPFIPCGVTIPLGNSTGVVSYTFAADEYETGAAYTTNIPSYRGIENPFGHIWKFIDGFNRQGGLDANEEAIEKIYTCNDVSKFAENAADGYTLISLTAPRANGNIGGIVIDKSGTFWPKPGGYTRYSDYFYNAYANGTWYTLYAGGGASGGSYAGLLFLYADYGAGYASALLGSRLLYTNNS